MADQEKQLDHLLDSLLANYSDVEPRPGLETRLLATVRETRALSTKPWHIWRWLLAGAIAVAMAVTVFTAYYARPWELPSVPRIQVAGPPTLPPTLKVSGQDAPLHLHPQKLRVELPSPVAQVDVRQEVFPTPIPLSEQEKLLLRYLAGTPREEVASQAHEDEPSENDGPLPESQRINGAEVFSTR